jgi:mannosyltransferase
VRWLETTLGARWATRLSSEAVVLGLLVVLAFATRFYTIGLESLWCDEIITYHRASERLRNVVKSAEAHHHNPAYFLLMHVWMKLGDNELMMRVPSAIFGALTVPVGYFLGRMAGGRWVAVATAFYLILHSRLVAYSQEARMYAPYVFGASLSIAGLVYLIDHPAAPGHPLLRFGRRSSEPKDPRATLAWVACTVGWILTVYSHATGVLFALSCSVVAAVRVAVVPLGRWRFAASFAIAGLLALLVYLPWLLHLAGQVKAFKGGFWAVFPNTKRLAEELGPVFFFGRSLWRFIVIFALALVGTRALRHKPLVLASLWILTLLGPGLLLLASLWQPMFLHRQFLWASLPFGVLVGAGLVSPPWPALRVALLVVAVLAAGVRLQTEYYGTYSKERWRDVIAFLAKRDRLREGILTPNHVTKQAFEYYFGRKTKPLRPFPYVYARSDADLPRTGRRTDLWVVTRKLRKRTELDAALLQRGWTFVDAKNFGSGIVVQRYQPTRRLGRRAPRML